MSVGPNYNIMKYIVLDWIFKGMDYDEYNPPHEWGKDFYAVLEEVGSEVRLSPDTYGDMEIDSTDFYIQVYGEDSHNGEKKRMYVQFPLNNFAEWDIMY